MDKTIKDFVKFVADRLRMDHLPKIRIEKDPTFSTTHKTFGVYVPAKGGFTVEVHGRNIVDVLRTIAHEMTHHRQMEVGSTKSRTDLEIEATTAAGMLVKIYCDQHPELYGSSEIE
jgi:hypothetical protein